MPRCSLECLEARRLFFVPTVPGFSLIDADTDRPVPGYENIGGDISLNLATLPTRNLSYGATNSPTFSSIRFTLDDSSDNPPTTRIENSAPYALFGDTAGDYIGRTPAVGRHTITATPYALDNAGGTPGPTKTLTVTVVNQPLVTAPPAATGRTFVVNATGSIKTISAAAQLARPGDVVLINPGRYRESITLPRSGTATAPITFAARVPGTVTIDGAGRTHLLRGSVSHITLRDLVFDGCANGLTSAAVQVGAGWRLTDVVVRNADGAGITVFGRGARLTRVTAEYNGQAGINGNWATDVVVTDSITRYNNRGKLSPVWRGREHTLKIGDKWYVDPTWEAGAGKWSNSTGVTLDGLRSYANGGPGVWFDYNNSNVTIRRSTVYDNRAVRASYEAVGINIELTAGGVVIENNTVSNNPGGNLVLETSRNVTVRNNTFRNNAVVLSDWPRGDAYRMRDVTFTGNRFDNCRIETWGDDWTATAGAAKNIRFDRDTFANVTGPLFRWADVDYTSIDSVRRRLGFELNGSVV